MTYGKQVQFTINGVNYPIAVSQEGMEFGVVGVGEALTRVWNNWQDGAGYTFEEEGVNGYYYIDDLDATSKGRIRHAPDLTATALRANSTTGFGYFFEIVHSGGTKFMGLVDGDRIYVYSFDGATLHLNTQVATAVFGRPVFWQGFWYLPAGNAVAARKMSAVSNPPVAGDFVAVTDSWKANHMCTLQQGDTGKVVRAFVETGSKANAIDLSATTGDITTASWIDGGTVGDTSTAINDLVETQGLLYVAKEDNLYEYDSDSIARPIIPFLSRSSVDTDNGKYTSAFGDIIFYPTKDGLWRYKIGADASIAGLDGMRSYTEGPGAGLAPPIRGRPYGGIAANKWIYQLYDAGSILLLMEPTPDGPAEFVNHIILAWSAKKGLVIDSANKLWAKEASSGSVTETIVTLGNDAGLEDAARDDGLFGSIILSGTYLDKPGMAKQLRAFRILTSGGTVDMTLKVVRDFGALDTIGSISAAGLTTVLFTPGTNDTADIVFPVIVLNAAGSSSQEVHELTLETKRPFIYRVLIPCDNDVLHMFGLEEEQAWQNLGRLLDAGFYEIEQFDQTVTAGNAVGWSGEVKSVTHTTYSTANGSIGRAIELLIHRYTVD